MRLPSIPAIADRAADPHVGAAIDIGSTSVHLLVARVVEGEGRRIVEPLMDVSEILGLGERVATMGELGHDATWALVEAVGAYVGLAAGRRASSIVVVATEALRLARDADRAIGLVGSRAARRLEILAPDEEALCTLVGVTHGLPLERECAVVDIGGGSTEIVVAGPGREPASFAASIGAGRLTSIVVAHDPPTTAEIGALRSQAVAALAGAPAWRLLSLVAVGGTATNLGRVDAADRGVPVDPSAALGRSAIGAMLDRLTSEESDALAARAGIRPSRARILAAGAALLEATLDRYSLDSVTLSPASLREGIILLALRAGPAWRRRLPELARGWR